MFLAVVILLLSGGDCISPLLADQKSKDCCAQGQCHRSQKKDPCCQTTPPAITQFFQAVAKVTVDPGPRVVTDALNNHTRFFTFPTAQSAACLDLAVPWPPGSNEDASLLLRV
jgi:hypothetical protein